MKLTLYLIALCSYLALSVASIIPDKKDSENDADRTSHDGYNYGGYYPEGPVAPLVFHPIPESPVAPAFPHPIPEFPGIPGGENDEDVPALDYGVDENDAMPDDFQMSGFNPEHTVLPDIFDGYYGPGLPVAHLESPHLESPHLESPHPETPHLESPHPESPHPEFPGIPGGEIYHPMPFRPRGDEQNDDLRRGRDFRSEHQTDYGADEKRAIPFRVGW